MARFTSLKKILITGACLCVLAPSTVVLAVHDLPPSAGPASPSIALPSNATVSSIVSEIVQHNDLRDADFIAKLLGTANLAPSYYGEIKQNGHSAFYLNYSTITHQINSADTRVARVELSSISTTPCIHHTDFTKLFDTPQKEDAHTHPGVIDYIFQKKVGSDFYLNLNVYTVASCANIIIIEMTKHQNSKS